MLSWSFSTFLAVHLMYIRCFSICCLFYFSPCGDERCVSCFKVSLQKENISDHSLVDSYQWCIQTSEPWVIFMTHEPRKTHKWLFGDCDRVPRQRQCDMGEDTRWCTSLRTWHFRGSYLRNRRPYVMNVVHITGNGQQKWLSNDICLGETLSKAFTQVNYFVCVFFNFFLGGSEVWPFVLGVL